MMHKGIVFLALLLVLGGCVFQQTKQPENELTTKYVLYGQGAYKEGVQKEESVFIRKSDQLPKDFTIDGEKVTIKEVLVKKVSYPDINPTQYVSFYLTVNYNNKDERIGFTHEGPIVQEDKDGCLGNICAALLVIETKRWETEPEVEGAIKTVHFKQLSLINIDYDMKTNDWNFIEFGTMTFKESQGPPTTDV